MGKIEINMKKPGYFGQAILDLSKTLMYEFHYDYMRPLYGSKVKLCYMDTNNFVYKIEAEDFNRDIAADVESRLNTSGYSKDDKKPLTIGKNKVIGLMKDDQGGKIMTNFVALREKMSAYRKIDCLTAQHEHFVACCKKRYKGIKKCVVAESLRLDDYKTCLFDGEIVYREQILFENKKHQVYTVNKHKIALTRDHDKRLCLHRLME